MLINALRHCFYLRIQTKVLQIPNDAECKSQHEAREPCSLAVVVHVVIWRRSRAISVTRCLVRNCLAREESSRIGDGIALVTGNDWQAFVKKRSWK